MIVSCRQGAVIHLRLVCSCEHTLIGRCPRSKFNLSWFPIFFPYIIVWIATCGESSIRCNGVSAGKLVLWCIISWEGISARKLNNIGSVSRLNLITTIHLDTHELRGNTKCDFLNHAIWLFFTIDKPFICQARIIELIFESKGVL